MVDGHARGEVERQAVREATLDHVSEPGADGRGGVSEGDGAVRNGELLDAREAVPMQRELQVQLCALLRTRRTGEQRHVLQHGSRQFVARYVPAAERGGEIHADSLRDDGGHRPLARMQPARAEMAKR